MAGVLLFQKWDVYVARCWGWGNEARRHVRPLVEKCEIRMRRTSGEIQGTSGVVKKGSGCGREVVRDGRRVQGMHFWLDDLHIFLCKVHQRVTQQVIRRYKPLKSGIALPGVMLSSGRASFNNEMRDERWGSIIQGRDTPSYTF
jgi:hypothetical protein